MFEQSSARPESSARFSIYYSKSTIRLNPSVYSYALWVFFLVAMIGPRPALGQLQFVHLLDNNTVRPDSAAGVPTFGPFNPIDYGNPLGFTTPMTDGKNVVFNVGLYLPATGSGSFTGCSGTNENSIWSIPVKGGPLTSLAGFYLNLEPSQPSNSSTATCMTPLLAGSNIFFRASYSKPIGAVRSGYFKVPASGGPSSAAVLGGDTLGDGTVISSLFGGGSGNSSGSAILSALSGGNYIDIFFGPTSYGLFDRNPKCAPYNNFIFNGEITSSDGLIYATWTELAGKSGTSYVVLAGANPSLYNCANVVYDSGNAFGPFTSAMAVLPGITGTPSGSLTVNKLKTAGGRVFISAQQFMTDGTRYEGVFEVKGGNLVKIVSTGDSFQGIPNQTLQCRGYGPQYFELSTDFAVTSTTLVLEAYGPATYICGKSATFVTGLVSMDLKTRAITTVSKTGDSLQSGSNVDSFLWGVAGASVDGALAADGHLAFMVGESDANGPKYSIYSTNLRALGTVSSVSVSPSTQAYFQNVTLTANVSLLIPGTSTPTGSVQFLDGSTVLSTQVLDTSGKATLTLDVLTVGAHSITAVYVGDDPFLPSTSNAAAVSVTQGATALALSTPNTTVLLGAALNLSAQLTVTSAGGIPTGNIDFLDGPAALGSVPVNAAGTANLQVGLKTAGTHNISAVYRGDINFTGSTSPVIVETVTIPAVTPVLNVTLQPGSPVVYGISVSATVTVGPPQGTSTIPTGKVTGSIDSGALINASLAGGAAVLNFGVRDAGPHAINVSYGGDATFAIFSAQTKQLLVTQAPLTVINGNTTRNYGAPNSALTATLSGLLISDNITAVPTSTATLASFVGTYPVTSNLVDPNQRLSNYAVTQNGGVLTVTPQTITATVSSQNVAYGQSVPSITGTLSGLLPADQPSTKATFASTASSSSGVGSYPVTGILSGPSAGNYTLSLIGNPVVTIVPAPLKIVAGSVTRAYGLANPAFNGTITGSLNNDILTGIYLSSATVTSPVGVYPITGTVTGLNAANYSVQQTNGALTVSQANSSSALTLSSSSTSTGQGVTLIGQVSSATSGSPTGQLTFLDGATVLGTGLLNAQGSASLTTSTLTLGVHLLSAVYSGDLNFIGSQTASSVETIGTSDYAISATPASATVRVGQSVQFTFLITSLFGYNQPVALGCSGLPAYATCVFAPSNVTPSAGGTAAILTVSTTAPIGSLSPMFEWRSGIGTSVACLLIVCFRRRRVLLRLTLLFVVICSMGLSGCGGKNSVVSTLTPGTPLGSDTITVSAAGLGGLSHAAQISIVVTP